MVRVKTLGYFEGGKKRLLKLQIANFRHIFFSGGSDNLCMKWMLAYKNGCSLVSSNKRLWSHKARIGFTSCKAVRD